MHYHEYTFCLALCQYLPGSHPFLMLQSCKEDCARSFYSCVWGRLILSAGLGPFMIKSLLASVGDLSVQIPGVHLGK